MKSELEKIKTDDKWTFVLTNQQLPHCEPGAGCTLGPHVWVTATSSNPNDPQLTLDPWRDMRVRNGDEASWQGSTWQTEMSTPH